HGRPPRAVLEEPQVDVVQPEGERHAEPLDAWENVDDRPGAGRLGPRMVEAHEPSLRYARGFTHVSDQAKHALDPGRSRRISAQGRPVAERPFSSTSAPRAGNNVLKTPSGRLLKSGGMVRTKGTMEADPGW